jgi:hypothetical protein
MRKNIGSDKIILPTVNLVHKISNCVYYNHMDIYCGYIYSHIPIRMSHGGKENEETGR